MSTKLTPETRLRNRIRDLERIVSNWPSVLLEREVWEYIEALTALHHAAHHQIRRPDDLGGSISGTHAASRAPSYATEAMLQLKAEKTHLARRTATIIHVLERVDGKVA